MKFVASSMLSLTICTAALAQEYEAGLSLPADNLIGVRSYDPNTETYCVYSVRLPGEGDSFVTTKGLVAAVNSLDADEVTKDPKGLVGKEFKTTSELGTIMDEKVETAHGECTAG